MKPGDLLVLKSDAVLFMSPFQEPRPKTEDLCAGDVLVYLDIFINPKVDVGSVDYCHVLKVLTRLGVRWVNDDGCVKSADV